MTGQPAYEQVHGAPLFPYLEHHLEARATFDRAMSERVQQRASALVATYPFPATGTVVDVGGGRGTLLAAVLRAYPGLHGILFDQPDVVASAPAVLEAAGVRDRCTCVGGSFFEHVPAGGAVYLLSSIIHDWDDARSITILQQCAQAASAGGKVVLIESVIEEGNAPSWAKLLDVHMLVVTGGRERTAEEYRILFTAAGLTLTRLMATETEVSLLEGEPAEGTGTSSPE